MLFAPASDERKLGRALESSADAVIADLEDAVVPDQKQRARELLCARFAEPGPGPLRLLRVNGAGSTEFEADLAILSGLAVDGVVLPKADPAAVAEIGRLGRPVLALIESAAGLRGAYEVASSPEVFALMLGAVDLAAELGLEPRADGLELIYARSQLVIDSRAAGLRAPFDGVHVHLPDEAGLAAAVELARTLGMRGKGCIHPSQLELVNRAFAPDPERVEWAHRVVEAAAAGAAEGRGAVPLEGELVDAAVVARARRILEESADP